MNEYKTFNVKIPKELWVFLKIKAAEEDTSMAKLILKMVKKIKKQDEKKLSTQVGVNV